jgi:hypothetical protein
MPYILMATSEQVCRGRFLISLTTRRRRSAPPLCFETHLVEVWALRDWTSIAGGMLLLHAWLKDLMQFVSFSQFFTSLWVEICYVDHRMHA